MDNVFERKRKIFIARNEALVKKPKNAKTSP
jgi:hypothetical protein